MERWRRSEANVALAAARGEEPLAAAFPPRDALELLDACRGDLEPLEAEATLAHLARAAAERTLEEPRDELEDALSRRHLFGRETWTWRALLAGLWQGPPPDRAQALVLASDAAATHADAVWREARVAGDRAAARLLSSVSFPPHADAGPDPAARHDLATRWLAATDDALAAWSDDRDVHDLPSLLFALRGAELDPFVSPRTRWKRLGGRLLPFGYERVLDRVVRVDAPHRAPWPAPRLVVRDSGRDLRLLPPRLDHGVLGEVLAAEVVGRAVALALVSVGLPPALARPPVATVARGFGHLFAQSLAEPSSWRRLGLDAPHAEAVARHASGVLLLSLRVHAAATLVRGLRDTPATSSSLLLLPDTAPAPSIDVDERCSELAARALGVELPTRFARALLWAPASSGARLRAASGALCAWAALRDRHDDDWYRNPRAEETLRAAFERGGALGIEAWTEELGASEADGFARARELFAR